MPSTPKTSAAKLTEMKTSDIINTVRQAYANGESFTGINFEERIPECTQKNLEEIAEIFNGNPELANSFFTEIINRIGLVIMNYKRYNNPLKRLKAGRLDYGDTVEEIAFGTVKAKCDTHASMGVNDVFDLTVGEVGTSLHKINLEVKYPISIPRQDIRKAFLSESSLGSFIDGLLSMPYNSSEIDEQIAFLNLLTVAVKNGFMGIVPITPVTSETTAKNFVINMRSLSTKLKWASDKYNKAGFPTWTSPEDLVVILDAQTDAIIDVEVLSVAFNMSKSEFMDRAVKITVPQFPVEGLHGIVADRRFFQIYDVLFEMASIWNPSNLTTNYFLHVKEILSVSPFVNALAFFDEKVLGSVTSVAVTPKTTNVVKGGETKFEASVEGTDTFNANVKWSVEGGTDSRINLEGRLFVGLNETSGTLTVKAESVSNPTISDTATVTII